MFTYSTYLHLRNYSDIYLKPLWLFVFVSNAVPRSPVTNPIFPCTVV